MLLFLTFLPPLEKHLPDKSQMQLVLRIAMRIMYLDPYLCWAAVEGVPGIAPRGIDVTIEALYTSGLVRKGPNNSWAYIGTGKIDEIPDSLHICWPMQLTLKATGRMIKVPTQASFYIGW